MRCLRLCAFLLLFACGIGFAAEPVPEHLNEKARILVDYQAFVRGEPDSGVKFYIGRAVDFAGTPLAELALRLAMIHNPADFSAVNVGEAEARRILAPESAASPEVVDLARRYVARAQAYAGRRDEAMAVHRQRGLCLSWYAAGGFTDLAVLRPADAKAVFDAASSISKEDIIAVPPTAAEFDAWAKNPPWRPIPESQTFPVVKPWQWAGGSGDGAVALRTGFVLENPDNRAEFHVFSETSWSIYLNGSLLATINHDGAEVPYEHVVRLPLSAEPHKLEVLLLPPPAGKRAEDMRFSLRLNTTSPSHWDREFAAAAHNVSIPVKDAERLAYFQELAKLANSNTAMASAYAVAAAEQGMFDDATWFATAVATAEPENLNSQTLAGLVGMGNNLMPMGRRRDLAAARQRKALELRPDTVPALLFLARLADATGRPGDAERYIVHALQVNPTSLAVLKARAIWANKYAGPAEARDAWRVVAETYPNSLSAQIAVASMQPDKYVNMDNRLAACRAAVAAGGATPESRMLLGDAIADSGDTQAAAAMIRETLTAFPGDKDALVWAANLYLRLGLYEEASQTMSDAIRLAPWRADLWRRLGDIALETHKDELALRYWRVSLAAAPGQYELDDLVRTLSGDTEPLQYDGGYDAVALATREDPSKYKGDVVRLLDRSVVVMERDGSFRRLTHEVDLILTRRGGEMLADIEVPGEVLTARTIFPNGATLEPERVPGRKSLRLPALLPGSAREVQYLEHHAAVGSRPPRQLPWFFQHPGGEVPFLLSEYEVRTPKGYPLVKVLKDYGMNIDYEKTEEEHHDIYRWTARMGMSLNEPDSAHVSERLASVETGTPERWDDLVYHELRGLSGRLRASRQMLALLNSLLRRDGGGRLGPEDSAQAIYRFVCDNIRQQEDPERRPAAHYLVDRAGERNILLLSMLRAAGFNASPAAARPNKNLLYPPNWELPRQSLFTIPLVRLSLPGGPIVWLDTRFETLPFGKLTEDLSDATVIAFLPDGPRFERLPRLALADSEKVEERRILLPANNTNPIAVVGRLSQKGVDGLRRREFMTDAVNADRRLAMLESLFPVFPDAELTRLDILRPSEEDYFSIDRYEIESSALLEKRDDGVFAIGLCVAAPDIISAQARGMRERGSDCHIRHDYVFEDRNTFVLPEGGKFVSLPLSHYLPGNFGIYQLRVAQRVDNQVEVIRKFKFSAQRIKPWEWADFQLFLQEIDIAERQWIEYVVTNEE